MMVMMGRIGYNTCLAQGTVTTPRRNSAVSSATSGGALVMGLTMFDFV